MSKQDDTKWQEAYVREKAKESGQAGGQPTKARGPAQSVDGDEHEEAEVGDTKDISPRGGVGIRETEETLPDKA